MPSLSLYVRYMDTQELKHDIREILVDDAAEYDALLWKKKKDEEKSRTA